MIREFLRISPWAPRPLAAGFAAFVAVAAVLVLSGCATSGAASGADWDDNDGVAAGAADMLPSQEEAAALSVHAAAEAVRAGKAEPEAAPAANPPVAPPAPAAVPAEPASGLNAEMLAALASEENAVDNDREVFTNDESKSRGNKFDPIIGQGYRLKVIVRVGDRDEVGPLEVMVSEKGDVSLPLLGRVPCSGLTINALHSRLSGFYSEFFADPDVDVQFAYSDDGISPYGQVLVQGRVAREGWVNIPPTRNLRLSHAIQRSGGFASSALRRKVLVLRRGEDGNLDRHVIDFKAIGKNGELDNDILLEPNDVIFVDESNF